MLVLSNSRSFHPLSRVLMVRRQRELWYTLHPLKIVEVLLPLLLKRSLNFFSPPIPFAFGLPNFSSMAWRTMRQSWERTVGRGQTRVLEGLLNAVVTHNSLHNAENLRQKCKPPTKDP